MIEPQEITPTYIPLLPQNDLIKLNDDYYYIKSVPNRSEYIDKITYPLRGDEIIAESGIYIYVIVGHPITNEPLLFAKRTLSIQEIQTKHMELLSDIVDKLKIPITTLYYAGEIMVEINTDNIIVKFNFLSGTYMEDKINPDDPQGNDVRVIEILKRNIGQLNSSDKPILYEYLPGIKSLINNQNLPVSMDLITNLLYSGAEIYKLSKENIDPTCNFGKIKQMISDRFVYYQPRKAQINKYFDYMKSRGLPNEALRDKQLLDLDNSILFDKYFVRYVPDAVDEIPPRIRGIKSTRKRKHKKRKHKKTGKKTPPQSKGGLRRKKNKSKRK
jgi:hypothetical protein